MKSKTAANAVLAMNPNMKIKAYSDRVGQETEQVFNEEFYSSMDGKKKCVSNFRDSE